MKSSHNLIVELVIFKFLVFKSKKVAIKIIILIMLYLFDLINE